MEEVWIDYEYLEQLSDCGIVKIRTDTGEEAVVGGGKYDLIKFTWFNNENIFLRCERKGRCVGLYSIDCIRYIEFKDEGD